MKVNFSFFIIFSFFIFGITPISAAHLPQPRASEQRVASKISQALVYQSGAKLVSTAVVSLSNGNSEIIFENLPISINPSSIQVRLRGGMSAQLLSAKFRTRYVETASADSKILKSMSDSIADYNDKFSFMASEREVLIGESGLISQNQGRIGMGATATFTVKDLQDLATFYRTRLSEIKRQLHELGIRERKMREPFTALNQRFMELSVKSGKTSGEIVLSLNTPNAQSLEVDCIYWVSTARWYPQYDLNAESIDKPLKLTYKAVITQSSGLDWQNVALKVSTANPNLSNNRPVLNPQYIDYQVLAYSLKESAQMRSAKLQTDERAYNMAAVPAAKPAVDAVSDDLEAILDETDNSETSAIFDIALPQTIQTDGQEHTVKVQEHELKANFEYHAVPKIDPSVFLLAKVVDYGRLNLVAGNANIFYQDTYIGQSFIDPRTVSDTLLLSLGRDENITIKRAKPVDVKSEKKIFGDWKKETIEYEITVKNNKRQSINLEIFDQVPISRQKDIEVIVDESKLDGADYNKTYGKLCWKKTIEANSSKRIRFGYTLKSPKEQTIGFQN
jgi:uncharacterized protein (TIGR02231 family)